MTKTSHDGVVAMSHLGQNRKCEPCSNLVRNEGCSGHQSSECLLTAQKRSYKKGAHRCRF